MGIKGSNWYPCCPEQQFLGFHLIIFLLRISSQNRFQILRFTDSEWPPAVGNANGSCSLRRMFYHLNIFCGSCARLHLFLSYSHLSQTRRNGGRAIFPNRIWICQFSSLYSGISFSNLLDSPFTLFRKLTDEVKRHFFSFCINV